MSVAWYCARVELRKRWRVWLSIALLIGLGGGLAMASVAAARRTNSALPRFLQQANAPDLVVNPYFDRDDSGPFLDAIGGFPGVVHRSDARAVALARVVDGQVDVGTVGQAVASIDGDRFYEHDRVHITQGRLPDPSQPHHVLVSDSLATEGIAVGDRLEYRVLDAETVFGARQNGDSTLPTDVGSPLTLEVTGVGIFPELALVAAEYAQKRLLVTPALYEQLPVTSQLWDLTGLHLAEGTKVATVRHQIQNLATEMGGSTQFEVRADITARAQRAVRPYVLALSGLGAAAAVFVVLLTTQLVSRTVSQSEGDHRVLRALAAEGQALRLGLAVPVLIAAATTAVAAIAVAGAISLLTPVGPVRALEPDPGASIDWLVGAAGAAVLAGGAVSPAVLATRRWSRPGRSPRRSSGRAMSWAQQVGAPLGMVLGIGQATGAGEPKQKSAARAGLVSVGLAIGMLVAIVTFSASLAYMLDHPEAHGWNADVALLGTDGYGTFDLRAAAEVDGLTSMSGVVYGSFTVEDVVVAGMGTVPLRGSLLPPLVDGHAPTGPGEIVLGQKSLHEIGASIGDTIDVRLPWDGDATPMTIVGTAVFPGLGQMASDRPTLASGALVVLPEDAIEEIGVGWSVVLAELAPDVNRETVIPKLVEAAAEIGGHTDVLDVVRPADIAAFADLGHVPVMLAVLLAVAALAALVHVLLVSARSWRRDRAVLASLGATPSELRTALRWHAVAIITIAGVVAVPSGAALGRWAWRSLAAEMGVVPEAVLPVVTIALVVVGLHVAGVLATLLPAHRAGRTQPATYLRAE